MSEPPERGRRPDDESSSMDNPGAPSNDRSATKPTNESTSDRFGIGRRTVIGGVLAAGLGIGWLAWERVGPGSESAGTGTTPGDQPPVNRYERGYLRDTHELGFSVAPSYTEESVRIRLDDVDSPIRWLYAAPGESTDGDCAVFRVDAGGAPAVRDLVVGLWTDGTAHGRVETTVDGTTVEFSLFSGSNVTLGAATRSDTESGESSDVYVLRGNAEAGVRQLLSEFDSVVSAASSSA